ncbi:MAG TPA: sulfatase [Thermoanaerobaculia bacterium]|nr:sulfatase [Thermoanaerobaculia bacterium]
MRPPRLHWTLCALGLALLLARAGGAARQAEPAPRFPNVLVITIDTLRADRLSGYGYRRATSPHLDRLLAGGARFTQARTVEPLTNPAICSLWTSLYPHEHGGTRNGLRMRPELPSLSGILGRRGYRTAAFVGNWTLKDRISGLGEHFGRYDEVFTRKRWLGLFKGEADARDLTDTALGWLREHRARERRPFLLWVHYVEPHAPYRLHERFAGRLGIAPAAANRGDRYDSEIAFVDEQVGRLLAVIGEDPRLAANTLVVFTADHGESLGEHGYWGHGRNLYEPGLRIPFGISWPGRLRPAAIDAPAVTLDVAPTVLGLVGLPVPAGFRGFDWAPVLQGRAAPPRDRVTLHQAHKGAVLSAQETQGARRRGLLAVAVISAGRKEIFGLSERDLHLFDLGRDPRESRNLAGGAGAIVSGGRPSERLLMSLADVDRGLVASDRLGPAELDPEQVQALRALGYVE